jgi:Ni,Fe-hydrogenase I large subunit
MSKVVIDPLSRIEGHLALEIEVLNGRVANARCRGNMFRGFETLLRGRHPVDANQITQRICGVCPISHGIASSRCLEAAFGIRANRNGRLLRNLVLGANFLQSHILHFYVLTALDYIDIRAVLDYRGGDAGLLAVRDRLRAGLTADASAGAAATAGPFLPRYEGEGFYLQDRDLNLAAISHYLQSLDIRMKCHRLVALFAGRVPHAIGLVPGGLTLIPTAETADAFLKILNEVERFIDTVYLPDVIAVAKAFPEYYGLGRFDRFLSYGGFGEADVEDERFFFPGGVLRGPEVEAFDSGKIAEQVGRSFFRSPTNLHPSSGTTDPDPAKADAYTWLKAPRYDGAPLEVGPLARFMIGFRSGRETFRKPGLDLLSRLGIGPEKLGSTLGRHAIRALEAKLLAGRLRAWVSELELGQPPRTSYEVPAEGRGVGLVEAARGALGHWITIRDRKIENYQCVVPTTWNASPMDDAGVKGPIEEALIGTPIRDEKNPLEAARVVRSFDPCLACAVHVLDGPGQFAP